MECHLEGRGNKLLEEKAWQHGERQQKGKYREEEKKIHENKSELWVVFNEFLIM